MRIVAPALAMLCVAGAASAGDLTATAYQVTPAHNAVVKFSKHWGTSLKTRWTATLDGSASFPLVVGRSVYALVAGEPEEIVRIDVVTGKIIWKISAGSGGIVGLAYDHRELFGVNGSGTLSAYAAKSGRLLWAMPLPGQYSFTAPPSALNGLVFVGGAGDGGTLYAVDEATGKLIWSQSVENGDESSPAVTATGVYVSYPCQYYDFAPATGAAIWHHSGDCEGGGGSTPVVADKLVFVRDYANSNSILNADTGAVVGTFGATAPPAVSGKIGYFLDGTTLSAVNPATSRLLWEFSGDGSINSPPLVVNGYVVVASDEHLHVIDERTGVAASTTTLGQPSGGVIGAGNETIFVPLGNTLVAFGSAS